MSSILLWGALVWAGTVDEGLGDRTNDADADVDADSDSDTDSDSDSYDDGGWGHNGRAHQRKSPGECDHSGAGPGAAWLALGLAAIRRKARASR